MKVISKKFGLVLMVIFAFYLKEARAQAINEKPCTDPGLAVASYCIDTKGRLSIVTKIKLKKGKTTATYRTLTEAEYSNYTQEKLKASFTVLKSFCGGLTEKILARDEKIKKLDLEIEAINNSIVPLQVAQQNAHAAMLTGCRLDCIKLAMVKNGVCALDKKSMTEVVSKVDLNLHSLGLSTWFGEHSTEVSFVANQSSVEPSKACSKMMMKSECKSEILESGISNCNESQEWVAAVKNLDFTKKNFVALKKQRSDYAVNSGDLNCKLTSAQDVDKPHWGICSVDCLQKALDSCPKILNEAEKALNRNQNSTTNINISSENQTPVIRSNSNGSASSVNSPADSVIGR